MDEKIKAEVLKGLEILHRGVEHNLLPEPFIVALYDALAYLVGQAGLASLTLIPADDRTPEINVLHNQIQAGLRQLQDRQGRG